MAKPVGWRKQPARHALAARGISTVPRGSAMRRVFGDGLSFPDGYSKLNLERDIKNGLVNRGYSRKDALDDIAYTQMMLVTITDEFEGEDRQRYTELSDALVDVLYKIFENPSALDQEDIHLWEKWLNVAYEKTKNGSQFDQVDAYLDAIEKYCIRLERVGDDPTTLALAQEAQGYSHDLLKMWT